MIVHKHSETWNPQTLRRTYQYACGWRPGTGGFGVETHEFAVAIVKADARLQLCPTCWPEEGKP